MNKLNRSHIARLTQVSSWSFRELSDFVQLTLVRCIKSFLVIQALYGLSMCTVKWSMLFMLKRIFAVKPFEVGYTHADNQHKPC